MTIMEASLNSLFEFSFGSLGSIAITDQVIYFPFFHKHYHMTSCHNSILNSHLGPMFSNQFIFKLNRIYAGNFGAYQAHGPLQHIQHWKVVHVAGVMRSASKVHVVNQVPVLSNCPDINKRNRSRLISHQAL